MGLNKWIFAGVCLFVPMTLLAYPARAQRSCTSSQNAAVECFASNAVSTKLLAVHYGMTMSQYKAYTVAVSNIIQAPDTNLVIFGLSCAVADAMPPEDADGSADQAAQTTAVNSIVAAEIASGIATLPPQTNQQDMQWFSMDLVNSMNAGDGVLLSPGTLLRLIDSYVVTSTSGGVVNWTHVNSNLATMVGNLASSGLLKLPASITQADVTSFAQSLARTIYTYKTATGRTSL
ncbi:MAG: hypothetical protein ACRD5K_03105 [Candidatus Acidiferrales bacterium]